MVLASAALASARTNRDGEKKMSRMSRVSILSRGVSDLGVDLANHPTKPLLGGVCGNRERASSRT